MTEQIEAANEKHNRIAREIVDKIYAEYPNEKIVKLLVLESLLYAFISGTSKEFLIQLKVLKVLVEGVIARLEKEE